VSSRRHNSKGKLKEENGSHVRMYRAELGPFLTDTLAQPVPPLLRTSRTQLVIRTAVNAK
jgi:hypothetical protein